MNDVLVLALAIIILCDIQAVKPLNKDYLSLESCNSFRGIFALVVIFHHLAQETSGGGAIPTVFTYRLSRCCSILFLFGLWPNEKTYIISSVL